MNYHKHNLGYPEVKFVQSRHLHVNLSRRDYYKHDLQERNATLQRSKC